VSYHAPAYSGTFYTQGNPINILFLDLSHHAPVYSGTFYTQGNPQVDAGPAGIGCSTVTADRVARDEEQTLLLSETQHVMGF